MRRLLTAVRKHGAAVLKLPVAIELLAKATPAQRKRVKAVQNEPAGLLYRTTDRETGAVGSVYLASEQGVDADTKYVVVCETHSNTLADETLKVAKRDAANTRDWCDGCQSKRR
jgi:hypothetical protein